jgi:Protein of unknown function (DUF1416)
MSSCGAVVGGVSLDRIDIEKEAVIQGVVINHGQPAPVGYVRLHDAGDEFTAEVPLNSKGEFRFFAAPGDWTVVTLVPGGSKRTKVSAALGAIADLDVVVA